MLGSGNDQLWDLGKCLLQEVVQAEVEAEGTYLVMVLDLGGLSPLTSHSPECQPGVAQSLQSRPAARKLTLGS